MLVTSGTVHVINFVLRTSENGEDVSNFSNSKYEICTLLKKYRPILAQKFKSV